ncbi:MAG: hypothetical protein ICV64_08680 [Thermoleophilia bacterium]|nr:hypothetical protein [Thermoleophilia bacterium]
MHRGNTGTVVSIWQLTTLFGRRPVALAREHDRWDVVLGSCCSSGATLDEALRRALRAPDTPRRPAGR